MTIETSVVRLPGVKQGEGPNQIEVQPYEGHQDIYVLAYRTRYDPSVTLYYTGWGWHPSYEQAVPFRDESQAGRKAAYLRIVNESLDGDLLTIHYEESFYDD